MIKTVLKTTLRNILGFFAVLFITHIYYEVRIGTATDEIIQVIEETTESLEANEGVVEQIIEAALLFLSSFQNADQLNNYERNPK